MLAYSFITTMKIVKRLGALRILPFNDWLVIISSPLKIAKRVGALRILPFKLPKWERETPFSGATKEGKRHSGRQATLKLPGIHFSLTALLG
jgi:hypothetical protein